MFEEVFPAVLLFFTVDFFVVFFLDGSALEVRVGFREVLLFLVGAFFFFGGADDLRAASLGLDRVVVFFFATVVLPGFIEHSVMVTAIIGNHLPYLLILSTTYPVAAWDL